METDKPNLVVILGGTGDIGSVIARKLASPTCELILGYLENHRRAENLANELRSSAAGVHLVPGNVTEPSTIDRIKSIVEERGSQCSSLIHSVAVTSFKPLTEIKPNQWDLILRVSARSLLDFTRALIEPLERAEGAIVAISSHGSHRFVPNYGALGPAKAALESTVRQLAAELAPMRIRVYAIRAGLVKSKAARMILENAPEELITRHALNELEPPEEVAVAVKHLLQRDGKVKSGTIVDVKGAVVTTG